MEGYQPKDKLDTTNPPGYFRPRLPEKEIELCLDLFDKKEVKERILKYIESVFDNFDTQMKSAHY